MKDKPCLSETAIASDLMPYDKVVNALDKACKE